MNSIDLDTFQHAVERQSVARIRLTLEAAASDGLVYPPTYEGGMHLFRPAWIEGAKRDAVLLDSVQSQANRVELALLEASRRGDIAYPDIAIDVDAETGREHYSVLELSHRVYDQALRLTTLDGEPFPTSAVGKAVYAARADQATALFEHAPITLALGGWDSHGGGGPLVAKLPRAMSSEIIGLDAVPVSRGAVKFDPMDIRRSAGTIYQSPDRDRLFEVDPEKAKTKAKGKDPAPYKDGKPSAAGLGNVPVMQERGAVITEARQTSVLSLAVLRRLRFETNTGEYNDTRDKAGRSAVGALALYGLLAQMEAGYNLRSGCDLIPRKPPTLEIIGRTLQETDTYSIDATLACELLIASLDRAEVEGLSWRREPLVASADDRLVTLIENSRLTLEAED